MTEIDRPRDVNVNMNVDDAATDFERKMRLDSERRIANLLKMVRTPKSVTGSSNRFASIPQPQEHPDVL